jgi:hypothetical protein
MARTLKQKLGRRKVGGHLWNQLLTRNQQRTREMLKGLGKLHKVAINADTENFIYALMLLCHENLDELYQLLQMDDALMAPQEDEDGPENLSL